MRISTSNQSRGSPQSSSRAEPRDAAQAAVDLGQEAHEHDALVVGHRGADASRGRAVSVVLLMAQAYQSLLLQISA